MKVYVAGPFFDENQISIIDSITQLLRLENYEYYSPKDHLLYVPGETPPEYVFQENCNQIHGCDFVIAVTNGKDVGTMFECGYAYAKNIPIAYVWLDPPEGVKFNLMLAQSAITICHSLTDLRRVLFSYRISGEFLKLNMPKLEEIE